MIEDFEAISGILKGELRETGMELTLAVSKNLDMTVEDSQVFQLSFIDAPSLAAGLLEHTDTSAVNVKEGSCPEQLVLF